MIRWLETALGVVMFLALVTGCARQPATVPDGALAGKVLLGMPGTDGHSGISVFIPGTSFQARTNRDGDYMITGLPAGRHELWAEHPGARSQSPGTIEIKPGVHTIASPAKVATIILESDPSTSPPATAARAAGYGSIRGFVFLEGDPSSDGVRVRIEDTRFVTMAESDGTYRFPLVEPGDYTLAFSKTGYEPVLETVRIEAGRETLVGEVAMLRAEAVTPPAGQAAPVAAGAPVPAAAVPPSGARSIVVMVEIVNADGTNGSDFSGVTVGLENSDEIETPDSRGVVRFGNLTAGVYRVVASLDGLAPVVQVADVTAEASARLTFRFGQALADPEGGIAQYVLLGQVVAVDEEAGDMPVAGATVAIGGSQIVGTTDEDGRFRISGVEADASTLLVAKEGFDDLAAPLDLRTAAQPEVDLGRLELRQRVDAPRVVSTSPVDGASNVIPGMELPIVIRFSRPMDWGSVIRSVRVFPDSNLRLHHGAGRHPLVTDDSTLVVEMRNDDDRNPIRFNSRYEVTVGRDAADREGRRLARDFGMSFRTGGFGVVGTFPSDGATDVSDGAGIAFEIQFNTRLRPESVREGNISIRPRPDSALRFTLSEDPSTGWTTVTGTTRLLGGRQYTVTVERGVRAATGQPLGNAPYRFSFRTGRQNSRR